MVQDLFNSAGFISNMSELDFSPIQTLMAFLPLLRPIHASRRCMCKSLKLIWENKRNYNQGLQWWQCIMMFHISWANTTTSSCCQDSEILYPCVNNNSMSIPAHLRPGYLAYGKYSNNVYVKISSVVIWWQSCFMLTTANTTYALSHSLLLTTNYWFIAIWIISFKAQTMYLKLNPFKQQVK